MNTCTRSTVTAVMSLFVGVGASAAVASGPTGWTGGRPVTGVAEAGTAITRAALPRPAPTILIEAAKGDAQVCLNPAGDPKSRRWEAAAAGMTLTDASIVRTGLDGELVVRVSGSQRITIGRFSQVTVRSAVRESTDDGQTTAKTALALPYGRVRVELDSTRVVNDVTIEAPDVVLAASGPGPGFIMHHAPGERTVVGKLDAEESVVVVNRAAGAGIESASETLVGRMRNRPMDASVPRPRQLSATVAVAPMPDGRPHGGAPGGPTGAQPGPQAVAIKGSGCPAPTP